MAKSILYRLWGAPEGPWLPNDWSLVSFDCFLLGLHVLTSLISLILWLELFYKQKAGRGHGGKDHRVLLHFNRNEIWNTSEHVDCRIHWVSEQSRKNFCSSFDTWGPFCYLSMYILICKRGYFQYLSHRFAMRIMSKHKALEEQALCWLLNDIFSVIMLIWFAVCG